MIPFIPQTFGYDPQVAPPSGHGVPMTPPPRCISAQAGLDIDPDEDPEVEELMWSTIGPPSGTHSSPTFGLLDDRGHPSAHLRQSSQSDATPLEENGKGKKGKGEGKGHIQRHGDDGDFKGMGKARERGHPYDVRPRAQGHPNAFAANRFVKGKGKGNADIHVL